ncbi:MAG: alcohol dehydrogenase catalytic domain-containing protein, partial [Anaerolineae bacterium]
MKQAFLEGVNQLVLKEVPKPEIERPDQILVRIRAVTICGADVHMLHGCHPPNQGKYPSAIGHEGAGIVEAVGDWVTDTSASLSTSFKPGDRVATKEWFNGCMAEYTLTTADNLLHIPDEMPFEQAAVLEPLHATYPLAYQCFQLGETVVIIGQGSVGLLFTQT